MQIRPSDVFLKSDIIPILRSIAVTAQMAPDSEYNRGFCAALAVVAISLSIAPADVVALEALPPQYW